MTTPAPSLSDLIKQSQQREAVAHEEAARSLQAFQEQSDTIPPPPPPDEFHNPADPSFPPPPPPEPVEPTDAMDPSLQPSKRAGSARKKRFEAVDETELRKRQRRTRWAGEHTKVLFPPATTEMPMGLNDRTLRAFLLRIRLEDMAKRILNPFYGVDPAEPRSPSPEPTYDQFGKRTNTLDLRLKAVAMQERHMLMMECKRLCPTFKPPLDYSLGKRRLEAKIRIPKEEFPDYNFFGLIIGPRGNTQKRLERETGCKIVIRGKGAHKDKSKAMKPMPGDNEDLHVLVAAENEDSLAKGVAEITQLLQPMDDDTNEHKKMQLMELAAINGTLRDADYCAHCGNSGHRHWQCPERKQSFKAADVTCAWCGDKSHPTSDCPNKGTGPPPTAYNPPPSSSSYNDPPTASSGPPPLPPGVPPVPPVSYQHTPVGGGEGAGGMDAELQSFMSEIGTSAPAATSTPSAPDTTAPATDPATHAAYMPYQQMWGYPPPPYGYGMPAYPPAYPMPPGAPAWGGYQMYTQGEMGGEGYTQPTEEQGSVAMDTGADMEVAPGQEEDEAPPGVE